MANKEKSDRFAYIAIVAIVAIVALVMLIGNTGKINKVDSETLAGNAISPGNMGSTLSEGGTVTVNDGSCKCSDGEGGFYYCTINGQWPEDCRSCCSTFKKEPLD